jgi:NADPH2:quinone reductase
LVQVAAAGVNFVEIYQRMGWYQIPLPGGLGGEGAGTVIATGPGVSDVEPGDRVAWLSGSGSYATHVLLPVGKLAPVPAGLGLEEAAALMVQGITAHVLTTRTYPVRPGDRVLVHAAAGGAGRMLVQMARLLGATVYGTVSTEAKAQVARDAGADVALVYTQTDFAGEIERLAGGAGVQVVYDSVGKDTFDGSLKCLAPLGYMVLYGQSSGFPPPFDIQRLAGGRSLFLTRPSVFTYIATREELLRHASAVFQLAREGKLAVRIHRRYPLEQATEAHRALAARETTGKLLLTP